MSFKIVVDSSADMLRFEGVEFASVPLTIITDEKEYVDDASLDVMAMVDDLKHYKGKSSTACPSVGAWMDAFAGADEVLCVTITSGLSGSYNSAMTAKQQYESEHPDCKVYVVDSLSAGPELVLIAEKLRELIGAGKTFDEICLEIEAYKKNTHLLFALKSLMNLARNGRVSKAVAAVAGVMNIRLVGKASDAGQLEPMDKVRGENKALGSLLEHINSMGYQGGKLRIAHCNNETLATKIKDSILAKMPNADVQLYATRALCSFYAEDGGILIGFEDCPV